MKNKIYGKGIYEKGKYNSTSPAYKKWTGMLNRCYNKKFIKDNPWYKNCKVDEEWLYFKKFAEWYEENKVEGFDLELDKDILKKGNRVYSSENCLLVPKEVNLFYRFLQGKSLILPTGIKVISNNNFQVRINMEDGLYTRKFEILELAVHCIYEMKKKRANELAIKYKDCLRDDIYSKLINFKD